MNPHYERAFDVAPNTFARSAQVEAEFERIEQGFDSVETRLGTGEAYDAELVAARQGQASLVVNLQRYVSSFAPIDGNLNLAGFRISNSAPAQSNGDLVTFAQLVAATTPGNPPAAPAETYGLSLTNREGVAAYALSTPDALALVALGIV